MEKISLKEYAEKLTEDNQSELFSYDLYNYLFELLKAEFDEEAINRNRKVLLNSENIDLI